MGLPLFRLLQEKWLASISRDRTIRLWDTNKGIEIARIELDAPATEIAAPQPNLIVVGYNDRLLWLEALD